MEFLLRIEGSGRPVHEQRNNIDKKCISNRYESPFSS